MPPPGPSAGPGAAARGAEALRLNPGGGSRHPATPPRLATGAAAGRRAAPSPARGMAAAHAAAPPAAAALLRASVGALLALPPGGRYLVSVSMMQVSGIRPGAGGGSRVRMREGLSCGLLCCGEGGVCVCV